MRQTLLFVVPYPVVAHLSVLWGNPYPALILLFSVFALLGLHMLLRRHYLSLLNLLIVVALTVALMNGVFSDRFALLYLPPMLVCLAFMWLFGDSLMSGKTPLVSRIALLHHGELPPRILRYTRRVTQMWTVFFTLLFLETLFLAFFEPLLTWSIYTNILNYLFAAGLMVGEYVFRIYKFKEVQHLSFFGFIRLLSKASVNSLR